MTAIDDIVRTLPVRPKRQPGESDPGYVLRLSARNGLPGAARLLSLCGVRAHGRARYCPACLGCADPTWSRHWLDAETLWCSEHGTWLIDECSRCGRSLAWRGLGWSRCRCGADLSKAKAVPVSADVLQFTPSELGRGSLVRWLGALSSFGLGAKAFKRADSHVQSTVRAVLESGTSMRLAWPTGFHHWLTLHRCSTEGMPALTVNTAWPGLVRYSVRLRSYGDRSLVRGALTSFVHMVHQTGTPVLGRNPSIPQPSKSLTATARDLGVSLKRLQVALPVAMPGSVAIYRTAGGRTRGALHPGAAPGVFSFIRDGISFKFAARFLGLSRRRVISLVDAEVLIGWGRYVSQKSCVALQKQLIDKAQPVNAPVEAESLGEVLRLCVPEHQSGVLFKAMVAGDIRMYRAGDAVAAATLLVRRADVVELLRAQRVGDCPTMTVAEAAKRLGVKQQVAYHLVRVGLLATTRAKVGRRAGVVVSAYWLNDFERRFAALVTLASAAGVGARRSVSWGIAQGLKFVSGPSFDGGRQYFVERPRNGDSVGEGNSGDAREGLHPGADRSGSTTKNKE